jgi:hypothetical protein
MRGFLVQGAKDDMSDEVGTGRLRAKITSTQSAT